MAHLREFPQELGSIIDALHRPGCSLRIVGSDIFVNVFQPALGLECPGYCCHERIRRPISSFEMVRLASESARPRATIV